MIQKEKEVRDNLLNQKSPKEIEKVDVQTEGEICASQKLDLLEGGELLKDFQIVPKKVSL